MSAIEKTERRFIYTDSIESRHVLLAPLPYTWSHVVSLPGPSARITDMLCYWGFSFDGNQINVEFVFFNFVFTNANLWRLLRFIIYVCINSSPFLKSSKINTVTWYVKYALKYNDALWQRFIGLIKLLLLYCVFSFAWKPLFYHS